MPHKLRKFIALSGTERDLLLQALAEVLAARLALWFLPFRSWRNLYGGPLPLRITPVRQSLDRIAWAIAAASTLVPQATCLVKAMAGRRLLAHHGHLSDIKIGVSNTPAFQAHAWLESNGEILLGGDLGGYTQLVTMERCGR